MFAFEVLSTKSRSFVDGLYDMNDKNFSDKLEAFGTLGANVPTKTDAAVLPSISPQERELAQVFRILIPILHMHLIFKALILEAVVTVLLVQ